jgi:type IV pilus assembly protein PilA
MFSSAIQRLNDRRHAAGDIGEDAGFTLIELMVVLLILAILLAIAIPTFLGVTKSANDRAAQSNLNTALINAKAQYQSNSQSYGTAVTGPANSAAMVTALTTAEPSLTFQQIASTAQNIVSVSVSADGNGVVLASYSKSGNCWYLVDSPQVITATNSASTTAPYPASGTATGTTAGAVSATNPPQYATAGNLTMPITAGTSYGEAKGDSTASDCSAAAPKLSGTGAVYQIQSSGFPS